MGIFLNFFLTCARYASTFILLFVLIKSTIWIIVSIFMVETMQVATYFYSY